MVDKLDPLWSSPAPLFSLLSPLESIANGWAGLPFLDVSSINTHITHVTPHHHTPNSLPSTCQTHCRTPPPPTQPPLPSQRPCQPGFVPALADVWFVLALFRVVCRYFIRCTWHVRCVYMLIPTCPASSSSLPTSAAHLAAQLSPHSY